MEYRSLGKSGLKVPALSFGTGTFGGSGPLFGAWGNMDVNEARRLVDICLDAGANLFDTADVYSNGASEEVLGAAIEGRRGAVLLSTKMSLPMGDGPNEAGSSRFRLIRAVEDALRRLGTDYVDLLQLHAFDASTPVNEVLSTLDALVRAGKIRYVGVSNFSGWQIMKSLAAAEKHGWPRYVANQVYYSLVGRDHEWDLMPLGVGRRGSPPALIGSRYRTQQPGTRSVPDRHLPFGEQRTVRFTPHNSCRSLPRFSQRHRSIN